MDLEYLIKKCMLGSAYGMCVTNIVRDGVKIEKESNNEPIDVLRDEIIEDTTNNLLDNN